MKIEKTTRRDGHYPKQLKAIAAAPKQLFYLGEDPANYADDILVAVVGSRKVSPYGRHVTTELAGALARHGIVIVSGLALGVDALAHQAAVEAGGRTIAVLPCGLDKIYPATNHHLAKRILATGGTLITEYPKQTEPFPTNFVARNRIISGFSQAVLITEAAEKSGSLHTANFALEQGREVLAVPGNITSLLSAGTNNLIKAGATPVTGTQDILLALSLDSLPQARDNTAANHEEHLIITLLSKGICDTDELLDRSDLDPALFNQTLTMMEITGKVKAAGGGTWVLL